MSCVISYKSGNSVYLAADGAATTEEGDIRPIECNKIIRNEDYLIGFAGSVRTGQLLDSHYFTPPDNIQSFVESLRAMLGEAGCLITTENSVSMLQSCFIVIHNNIMYEILSDFQLNVMIGSYGAIGAGTPYAYAAMEVIQEMDLSPSQKLEKALDVVTKFNATVRPPYQIIKY